MATKQYQVRFTNTSVGRDAERVEKLYVGMALATDRHGPNLPAIEMDGDHYQVRSLFRVGRMWRGAFARLRDDAPHVVDHRDQEHELELEEGDRLLDKSFFLYYEDRDVLVFQLSRNVGGLNQFSNYWARLLEDYVELPVAVDTERLDELLRSGIYEVQFSYARPPTQDDRAPSWSQRSFDMIRSVHAAQGSFMFRAPRHQTLGGQIRGMIRWMAQGGEVTRAKVKLTDEKDPIDLFLSPVKDRISVQMLGRYPHERSAIEALGDAYERQASRIPHHR